MQIMWEDAQKGGAQEGPHWGEAASKKGGVRKKMMVRYNVANEPHEEIPGSGHEGGEAVLATSSPDQEGRHKGAFRISSRAL